MVGMFREEMRNRGEKQPEEVWNKVRDSVLQEKRGAQGGFPMTAENSEQFDNGST